MTILRTKPLLTMEIEGHGEFQVTNFHSDWAKNAIPRAVCVLAVGRRANDGLTAARIHSERNKLVKMLRVRVFFKAAGQFDDNNNWPAATVVIFDGRLMGFGFQKIRGKINLTAHVIHWVADMNFSSALSSQSHPSNPTQYTFAATVGQLFTTGVATGKPFGIAQTAEARSITAANVQADLWAKALKPLLCALATERHVKIGGELQACIGLELGKNDQALTALKRFEGPGGDCGRESSCYTPPLAMNLGESVPQSVILAIAQAIRRDSIDSYSHNTLWSKLLEYASAFKFAVIPLVDKAIVVPFTAGLRETYCKQIFNDEYDHIDISGEISRPIRAVAVASGRNFKTGILSSDKSPVAMMGVGGCFAPEDADKDGMIYFIRPPIWLETVPAAGYSAVRTLGLEARHGTSSSTTPRAIDPAVKGAKDGKTRENILRETAELMNGYAHSVYMQEVLRGRVGALSGKLRFDIAPGSTVQFQGSSEQFLKNQDDLGQSYIGDVVRVSISIDAEAPRAGTAFQFANCRTLAENKDAKTSVQQHPLYTSKFTGAPLVDEFQFKNDECC